MNRARLRALRIRVALFTVASLTLVVVAILILGRSQSLFARKAVLHASFKNTGGLISGAAVRLAGVDIGIVRSIHFDPDLKARMVDVDLSVGAGNLERIRTDSVAQITSKGLLGDMIVDITLGTPDRPRLRDGGRIDSVEAAGVGQVIDSVQDAIKQVKVLASDVDDRLHSVLTPEATTDFQRITRATADVMETVEHGPGLVHALIYEPALADRTGEIMQDMERIAGRAEASIGELQTLLTDTRTGDGLVHGLIYDRKGGETVADLHKAASDLLAIVEEVKSGNGLVHSLVYETDRTNLIENLSAAAKILRKLAEETEEGKGTIGGLLKDPTVYEDMTTILDNLKRNALLKALVRFTIVKDNLNRPGRLVPKEGAR